MKTYILEMKINGVKNIETECIFSFYKKNIGKTFDMKDYNVKAIYGMNGAGKSAVVHAVNIFKKVLTNNILSDKTQSKEIVELINKKTKKVSLEVMFLLYDSKNDESIAIITHEIEIGLLNDLSLRLLKEKISVKKSTRSQYTIIYSMENNKIIETKLSAKLTDKLINLTDRRSVIDILMFDYLRGNLDRFSEKEKDNLHKEFLWLIPSFKLSLNMGIYMEESDTVSFSNSFIDFEIEKRNNGTSREDGYNFIDQQVDEKIIEGLNSMSMWDELFNSSTDYVSKSSYDDYYKNIKNLEMFIKLFKNDLVKIEIESIESKDMLFIEKYFVYDGYRINTKFESAGIKKLLKVYNAFKKVSAGGIVFYDELDANINDVYLIKLIEYASEYTQGQLIFTTHNLGPMEILKSKRKSIDFIDGKNGVVEWTKSGNYSIVNLYRTGMIKNQPFNLDSYNFIGIFAED